MTTTQFPAATLARLREHGQALWLVPVKNPSWHGCLTGDCPHDEQKDCDEFMAKQCSYSSGDVLTVEGFGPVRIAAVRAPVQVADLEGEDIEALAGQWVWPVLLKLERRTDAR